VYSIAQGMDRNDTRTEGIEIRVRGNSIILNCLKYVCDDLAVRTSEKLPEKLSLKAKPGEKAFWVIWPRSVIPLSFAYRVTAE
jgi:hypothetical protein